MDSKTLWKKALTTKQEWDDKDSFLDVLYWFRQLISILLGIAWGILPLTGTVGIISYLFVSCGTIYAYCTLYQQIDEEEFGGLWELLKEGFMTSLAIFLVNWTVFYTACQF